MGNPVFLEIIFLAKDFAHASRDEIEDPLHEALEIAGVGEVTGGGSGVGKVVIEVEVNDLQKGLAVIRGVLAGLGVSRTTVISQNAPDQVAHRVYE